MNKRLNNVLSVIMCLMMAFTLTGTQIAEAGAVADSFDIKDDLGGFVTDNTADFVSGTLADVGTSSGQTYINAGSQAAVRTYRPDRAAQLVNTGGRMQALSNALRGAGFFLNVYNTGTDTYKLFTEDSKHETTIEKAIDKGLLAIDTGMGWYAVGAGTIALITAPAWGTGIVAAGAVTGTTYVVSKIGVGLARVTFNSQTYRNISGLIRGTKKLTFAPFQRPGMKEGLDIIKEELGFDLYPGLKREIPDPSTGIPVYKPNIYLYADTDMDVNVMLYPAHWITVSEPLYSMENGWNAAVRNGSLNGTEDFLFYEAVVPDIGFQKEEGWEVRAENRKQDMVKILDLYGFSEKEKIDFLDYWMVYLDCNQDYIFYPQVNEQLDLVMPLITTPEADNVYRVWFYILPYSGNVKQPDNPEKIKRQDFAVIEWGGILP